MKKLLSTPTFLLMALALGLATLIGCDSFGTSASGGTVRVLLTDAPIGDIAETHVTIQRVELVGEAGVEVLSDEEQTFDLLELQDGLTADLAERRVPEGEYNQLRIVVAEEARVVFTDESEETLKIPSGAQTGVKINIPEFDIEDESDEVVIVADFDAEHSFVKSGTSGKYIFKPVIQAKSIDINGRVFSDEIAVTGALTSAGDEELEVEGFAFVRTDTTEVEGDITLEEGRRVELGATQLEDGTLVALDVALEDESENAKLRAPLDEVEGSAIVALGTSFAVTAETSLDGIETLSDLVVDQYVEIDFAYDAEADTYTALEVALEGTDG